MPAGRRVCRVEMSCKERLVNGLITDGVENGSNPKQIDERCDVR